MCEMTVHFSVGDLTSLCGKDGRQTVLFADKNVIQCVKQSLYKELDDIVEPENTENTENAL